LNASQQRAILNALKSFERVQFSALLQASANEAAEARPSDNLAPFSPWLRELIHSSTHEPGESERSTVTPKTRALIVELANSAWTEGTHEAGARVEPSRSLLDTMTDFVIGRRGR
jgi:hypothetical protein